MNVTSTASGEEIARFNALAATWWDPAGPMWPLHRLNAVRVPFIVDTLRQAALAGGPPDRCLDGLRILDIGCGAGILSESMAALGADVTGVDPAERNIAIARHHAQAAGLAVTYRHGSVDSLELGQFDVVLNMEVVEHVQNVELFMARCCDATAAGGLQFLATINRNPLSWLVAIVGAEYVLRWLPRGTHQWRKFVKPAEAAALLGDGGLAVIASRGVSVNPLTRGYRITDFLGVNYMLAARRAA